jgi:RimJ/RimL family protein N-acetyltransferase
MRAVRAEGLVLEPQEARHADEMYAVLIDPALYEFERDPPPTLAWLRERFARLESRRSGDGGEEWLNWVIRLPDGNLAGYVQATVARGGSATIAYELASAYWGRGLGRRAVEAMIGELATHHGVRRLSAVLKRDNLRSMRLLERLGFAAASGDPAGDGAIEADELLMRRDA